MAIGPQGVVRSEVEGGLSGPANPIPNESIDCGCGQLPCPKLARFATRGLFVGLVGSIGLIQAAAQAYLFVTSSTIARRFHFNPYVIDWVIVVPEITPLLFGLLVAYWGDRIHRAAWTGGLVMLQGVGYLTMLIPHFTSNVKIIEETENVTHMSLYADDSPDLCSPALSMLVMKEVNSSDLILGLIIVVQILSGIANVAYYALTLSYLDDNTKKKTVAFYIGWILSVKFFGVLLGYLLAWGCLRIDAENFHVVESSQEQIGAWWLGWPILAFALFLPAGILAIFPRRLPSEVVEQAAASILDSANGSRRSSLKSYHQKYGSATFFSSMVRLVENKIVIFNVIAAMFAVTALINFMANENIFLESRYYIPRPTGMYLGFGDPWTSRLVANISKPIIVGLTVILAGLIIVKARPRASYVAGYNVCAMAIAATVFLALAFATCDKPTIVGAQKNSLVLLKYCNKNCRCSRDADFRPVCDLQGKFTFYSACHAGCTTVEFSNNTKFYQDCSCVQEMLGLGNTVAVDGPCSSTSCHIGWMIFQVSSVLISALLASASVGNIIIIFRSIFPQDKALSIGFNMTWIAFFAYIPGKILYERLVNRTCVHWGTDGIVCHLYDTDKLGDYLCYLSAAITFIAVIFQFLVWVFTKNLKLYGYPEVELPGDTELKDVQVFPLLAGNPQSNVATSSDTIDENPNDPPASIETRATVHPAESSIQNQTQVADESGQRSAPLKYGPLGLGNLRTNIGAPIVNAVPSATQRVAETEDELDSSSDDEANSQKQKRSTEIAYKPLELDSDLESDLSGTGPRSRKNIFSKDFDPVLNNIGIASFPKLANSRTGRSMQNVHSLSPVQERIKEFESKSDNDDGFSNTDSFEYAPKASPRPGKTGSDATTKWEPYRLTGDFNEVGIPTLDLDNEPVSPTSPVIKIQSIQATQENFQGHMSRENLDKISSYEKLNDPASPHSPLNVQDYKVTDIVAEPEVPPLPQSPPPQSSGSSGIGSSLLSDTDEKNGGPVINKAVSKSREHLDRESPATSPPS